MLGVYFPGARPAGEIEPSGAIFFAEKEPTPEEARHAELLDRLERIESELSRLRQSGSQHAAV